MELGSSVMGAIDVIGAVTIAVLSQFAGLAMVLAGLLFFKGVISFV